MHLTLPIFENLESSNVDNSTGKRGNGKNQVLESLLPYLFPESYQKEVYLSLNGYSNVASKRSYILWNEEVDILAVQSSLLSSLRYVMDSIPKHSLEELISYLEWMVDDPIDDCSYITCMESAGVSKLEAYDLTEDYISNKHFEAKRHLKALEMLAIYINGQEIVEKIRFTQFKGLCKPEPLCIKCIVYSGLRFPKKYIQEHRKKVEVLKAFLETYF